MFNPFYPFTKPLLDAFLKEGKRYFVRQTFNRAQKQWDEGVKGYFMITHYDRLVTAQDHYGAIDYDRNRFLYDSQNPEHLNKLKIAANQPSSYRIFASVLKPDWDRFTSTRNKDKLRMYIKKLGWNPHRDEGVITNYELQFGELYIRIKYGGREAKVKFEEVEKIF